MVPYLIGQRPPPIFTPTNIRYYEIIKKVATRIRRIKKNIEKINNGTLIYDPNY